MDPQPPKSSVTPDNTGLLPPTLDRTRLRPADPRPAGANAFLSPPQLPDEIGRLGSYRVLAELGRGGMGVVFLAEETDLKRQVALKVMLPEAAADPQAVARFRREAEAQAKVEHDHVTVIYRVDEANGVSFLTMPLLKGQTLAQALRQNSRPPVAEVGRVGAEVAEGLAAAHAVGLVHRDIKPANVWLEGGKRRVKILDFGLARVAAGAAEAELAPTATGTIALTPGSTAIPTAGSADADTQLTAAGLAVGTPAYMSPEQARGQPTDSRTDLFSLGVLLYEMATGKRPFGGSSTFDILAAVVSCDPPPARELNPAVPPALSDLIGRLMAKDAAARPAGAAVVADELAAVGRGLAGLPVVVPLDSGPNPWVDLDSTESDAARPAVPPQSGAPRHGSRWLWPAVGLACAVAIGAAVWAASALGPKSKPTPTSEPVAVAPKPPPPVRPKEPPVPTLADLLTSSDWDWAEPENLGPEVNSAADELDPALSGDGLRLVYLSLRDGPPHLYEARRNTTAEPFGRCERLATLSSGGPVGQPFLSADGLHLVFTCDRPGGVGRLDLWESRRANSDASWPAPQNFGKTVNDPWDDEWPALSPDGLTLYFTKWNKWVPTGKAYFLVSLRRTAPGAAWGPGEGFGPEVNTPAPQIAPRPLADGKSVAFTRLTANGADWVLAVGQPGGGWDVRTMRTGVKDFTPTFTADGRTVVFASSDRLRGQGKSDLWQMRRVPKKP